MTDKQALAKEYAVLKTAVWRSEGVDLSRNSEKDHEKRALRFMTVAEISEQCDILCCKLSSMKKLSNFTVFVCGMRRGRIKAFNKKDACERYRKLHNIGNNLVAVAAYRSKEND